MFGEEMGAVGVADGSTQAEAVLWKREEEKPKEDGRGRGSTQAGAVLSGREAEKEEEEEEEFLVGAADIETTEGETEYREGACETREGKVHVPGEGDGAFGIATLPPSLSREGGLLPETRVAAREEERVRGSGRGRGTC